MLLPDDVIPLRLAEVSFPEWHPRTGQTGPVYAFVIRHRGGTILVDSGIGPENAAIDSMYHPERIDLDKALASGLSAEDIQVVLNTHLHFDHCGWNHALPGVRIVVQKTELEEAKTPGYTVREWVDFAGAAYDAIDGEVEIADGVRLVPTPGHTRGHQSAVVDTTAGRVVIAGQVAETASEFATSDDASVGRLRALHPVQVLFSHDDEIWEP